MKAALIFNIVALYGLNGILCDGEEDNTVVERFKIEGKVIRPETSVSTNWYSNTKVYTNSGHIGFLKEDGSFTINNVPWGSHVVYVMNPIYGYESVRVDINSKGQIRARVVSNIQPSKVDRVPYPLKFKTLGTIRYFQQREQWRVTDLLLNPMVLMTVLPLALMMLLPRLNDPETRKEMEQIQMPKVDTPDLSEMLTSLFGGGAGSGASSSGTSNPASNAVSQRPRGSRGAGRKKEK